MYVILFVIFFLIILMIPRPEPCRIDRIEEEEGRIFLIVSIPSNPDIEPVKFKVYSTVSDDARDIVRQFFPLEATYKCRLSPLASFRTTIYTFENWEADPSNGQTIIFKSILTVVVLSAVWILA